METLKIAIFSWESLYSDRVGGLASAATYMAQTLAKRHEVHFFTRGDKDFNLFNVQYHVWRPYGRNIIEYCNDLSHGLVARFRDFDNPPFDIIHFNCRPAPEAISGGGILVGIDVMGDILLA